MKHLPEPKNSDDYYIQNDNIISNEFSGINNNFVKYLKKKC